MSEHLKHHAQENINHKKMSFFPYSDFNLYIILFYDKSCIIKLDTLVYSIFMELLLSVRVF